MEWLNDNLVTLITTLFGAGGLIYGIVMHFLKKRSYNADVKEKEATADIKSDEFWKHRYDVLENEMKSKDTWWKERYDNLYSELQNERKLSNEIVANFRAELNQIREDYERQRESDKKKYGELLEQYNTFQEQSAQQNRENMNRITQLENLVTDYERRLNIKPNHE